MHCELFIRLLDDIHAEVRVAAVEAINKLEEGVIGRCAAAPPLLPVPRRIFAREAGPAPCVALHHIASCLTASHRIAPHRTASHRIAPHRTASHRIAPPRTA